MKVIAVSQARTGSTRLPNKVLKEINGKSLLEIHIDRILRSKKINKLIIATTKNKSDDIIEQICSNMKITCFRGDENNVLDRFYQAVKHESAEYIVRLTSDCPLIDAELIDKVVDHATMNKLDYCSNILLETFPDGEDIEVISYKSLEAAWMEADKNYQKEHVTPFIRENSTFMGGKRFSSDNVSSEKDYGKVRLTVDEQKDLEVMGLLISKLGTNKTWMEYAEEYLNNDDINKLNSNIKRNEGFKKN